MISYWLKVDGAVFNDSGASDAGADNDSDADGDDNAEAFYCNN